METISYQFADQTSIAMCYETRRKTSSGLLGVGFMQVVQQFLCKSLDLVIPDQTLQMVYIAWIIVKTEGTQFVRL